MYNFRLYTPAFFIILSNLLITKQCGSLVSSGKNVPFRPPGWVFGVVWPILYFTTGFAWSSSKKDYLFSMITALCCLWLYIYSSLCCNYLQQQKSKKAGAGAAICW